MGKIIGCQGNTANSSRTLLRFVGMKNNSRVNLKINEPAGGLRSPENMGMAQPAPEAHAAPAPARSSSQSASKTVDEAMADLKLE